MSVLLHSHAVYYCLEANYIKRKKIPYQFTVDARNVWQLDGRSHIMSALGTDILSC